MTVSLADVIRDAADWLGGTPLSQLLQANDWTIPLSQSMHIAGIGLVAGSAVILNLKAIGVIQRGRSLPDAVQALRPWMSVGLALVVLTGLLQTIAEPLRQFVTPVFWIKLGLLLVVLVIHRRQWGRMPRMLPAKPAVVVMLLLWVAVVVAGRWIGYTYDFYL